jgi:hypothetical protein
LKDFSLSNKKILKTIWKGFGKVGKVLERLERFWKGFGKVGKVLERLERFWKGFKELLKNF